ncbi:MAG: hypothetical protein AAB815_00775 [Patescibacteria group bacterium]
MKNKYSNIPNEKLFEKYNKVKHLKNIFSFNNAQARKQAEADFCFIEAEMIKRKLNGNAN